MTTSSSIIYFSSLNIFIPTFFSSSTTLITLLSPFCVFLILSLRLLSSTNVSVLFIYSGFINIWFLLFFSASSCQSGLLLNLSIFFILFSRICFKVKLNHDRYNVYLACLWFNFWLVIKYYRFL